MSTKGKTLLSLFVSLVITLSGTVVNYLYYLKNGFLLLAYRMYGGEITEEFGFGLQYAHIYTMEPGGSDSTWLKFDPLNLLVTFAVIFVIVYVIVLLTGLPSRKKER